MSRCRGGEKIFSSLLTNETIEDRHRGAAVWSSSILRTVREPYVDELLDIDDAIDESDVDVCMINYKRENLSQYISICIEMKAVN